MEKIIFFRHGCTVIKFLFINLRCLIKICANSKVLRYLENVAMWAEKFSPSLKTDNKQNFNCERGLR